MLRAAILCLAICIFPVVAAAEENSGQCETGEDCTEYFFDGDEVTAQLRQSDFLLLQGRGELHRPPLIRTRVHYVREMIKSVEDI